VSQALEFDALIPIQNLEDSLLFLYITLLSLNVDSFWEIKLNLSFF